ncbi:MAG TPA: hypothetical protein VK869_10550, partial [Rubrobacteraceae bacterium]|nr:hypothetical protein [Rubrobacteraceae bacterium]
RTPEEMEQLRQEAEHERAELYRQMYELLGLKVIAFKDETLEVTGTFGLGKITLGPDDPPSEAARIAPVPDDDLKTVEEDRRRKSSSPRPTASRGSPGAPAGS